MEVIMTNDEKDAVIGYLDYKLLVYVETFERHVPDDVKQQMYEDAYAVVVDMEMTLDTQIGLQPTMFGPAD